MRRLLAAKRPRSDPIIAARNPVAGTELRVNATLIAVAQRGRQRVGGIRRGVPSSFRIDTTMCCTCSLVAAPVPTTACLISRGAYSNTSTSYSNVAHKCRRSRVAEFQRAAGVLVHEDALDRDDIRSILRDDAAN